MGCRGQTGRLGSGFELGLGQSGGDGTETQKDRLGTDGSDWGAERGASSKVLASD